MKVRNRLQCNVNEPAAGWRAGRNEGHRPAALRVALAALAFFLWAAVALAAPPLNYSQYIPLVQSDGERVTAVALHNLSAEAAAAVVVHLYRADGTRLADSPTIAIPANGQAGWYLAGGETVDGHAWADIRSDMPLTATCLSLPRAAMAKDPVRRPVFPGASSPGGEMDVPVLENISSRWVFSHAVNLADTETAFFVANPNDTAVAATARFYDQAGALRSEKAYAIPANGSLRLLSSELMGGSGSSVGVLDLSTTLRTAACARYEHVPSRLPMAVVRAADPTVALNQAADYQASLARTSLPNTYAQVSHSLWRVTPDNDRLSWQDGRVLVVTWTNYNGYDAWAGDGQTHDVGPYAQWVTLYPEMREFCQFERLGQADIPARIEQVLGMPPGREHTRMVEMWVSPEDMFRPSPDPEISDTAAETDFFFSLFRDYKSSPLVEGQTFVDWFNNLKANSYTGDTPHPWTRLGYTFDWGRMNNPFGMSEFIVRDHSQVIIQAVHRTDDYCRAR